MSFNEYNNGLWTRRLVILTLVIKYICVAIGQECWVGNSTTHSVFTAWILSLKKVARLFDR